MILTHRYHSFEAESRDIPYLFKIRRPRNVQKPSRILSGGKGWKVCDSGWEALSQLYRDRGDCENNFDEFKNQWG